MDDTVADRDAELAMLMAMTGATVKQASDALDESGGDVDAATTYLNKGDLEKAATISKKMQSTSMKARSRHRREDVVDEDSAAKPNVVPRSTSPNTKATRAHQESLRYSPGRVSRATKKEYTHYKTGKLYLVQSLCALSTINLLTLACSNSWRRQKGRYCCRRTD